MKQLKKRGLALGLALVLALSPMASASDAMGREIQGSTSALSAGTSLTKQIFWSDTYSDLRTERYFTYTGNPSVTPTIVYGSKVLDRATLSAMAQSMESQGKRVVGGINGDLYVLATGAPLGIVITDGVLRSAPSSQDLEYCAVGFRSDGTAFVGQPKLSPTVTFLGTSFYLKGGINKVRNAVTDYVLYTSEFAATTQNSEPGIDVILSPVLDHVGETVSIDLDVHNGGVAAPPAASGVDTPPAEGGTDTPPAEGAPVNGDGTIPVAATVIQSAAPTLGGRVTYVVEQVLNSTAAIPIPEGKAVLSINSKGTTAYVDAIKLLQPGDTVNLDVTTAESVWLEATQAMGARFRLVTGGQVATGLPAERTAYTAVGVKADGSAIFYTVDGKQPGYSTGATLTQVAMRLVELGCVDAVSLDGGGSTTAGATYPDGSAMGIVNKPADGKERANSIALFLTTDLKPSGQLAGTYVTPGDAFLLSGTTVQMTAKGLDSNYYTMDLPGKPSWFVQNGDGAVDTSGVFTAGGSSGVTQVAATSGAVTGSATLTVVNNPDKLTLVDATTKRAVTALALDPGAVVDLTATAFYKSLPLTSQDTCFTWSVDAAVGTVDAQGVLTAGAKSGSGNLVVTVAGATATIPVSVAGHVNALEGFEGGLASVTAAGGLTLSQEKDADRVRYGTSSLKAAYDAAAGTASVVTTLSIIPGEKNLSLWVYGDGSHNSLTATFADASGVTKEVMLTGLDFTGWRYVTAELPTGAKALRSINLIFGDEKTGVFWLDQLTTSNEPVQDDLPPVVSVSRNDLQLTAVVSDFMDKKFTPLQINVIYDGKGVPFTLDTATGIVTATLPASDGGLHRAAVIATDASGNIGRGSLNIDAAADRPVVFGDITGHWAAAYAVYLYERNITSGVPGPEIAGAAPTLLFQPDKAITRGEFFSMAGRWLGLDMTKYADTVLPFADTLRIPDWALPGVKAMYALGYLKGSTGADGLLYVNADTDITRAEAMTILGRMQAQGYAQGDLSIFGDAAAVPTWAAFYVKTLVGQGIVRGGGDGLLHPGDSIRRGEVAQILFAMT